MKEVSPSDLYRILAGCAKGKREQQKELYQAFYSYAMNICLLYGNDREDAVEIMNDGYMKIFRYIGKFDTTKPFKPWLRKVMVNAAIDRSKKNMKHQAQVDIDKASGSVVDNNIIAGISHDEILGLLHQLSPMYRTVFNLHAIEGYKHEEIAEMLGIALGTSKSNYAKAKKRLQDLLKGFFEEENV